MALHWKMEKKYKQSDFERHRLIRDSVTITLISVVTSRFRLKENLFPKVEVIINTYSTHQKTDDKK